MSDEPLNDDERRTLYTSLLRGLANECQDRLCAADKDHAWGQVVWREIRPDMPMCVLSHEQVQQAMNMRITRAGERTCQNCGKHEHVR